MGHLIPPPMFTPDGPATGSYHIWDHSEGESVFTECAISYQDYALGVADATVAAWVGTALVATTGKGREAAGPIH